ncbi:rhamnogalacturonase B [Panaeolus papilionaceus]|nr:rhamnogalacturonase B [Panaeolus papilionaceus]
MLWKSLAIASVYAGFLTTSALGFGFTISGTNINVETDAGLTFTVASNSGDITSMKFNGIEAQDQGSKKSHISSGIGASCSAVRTGNNNNYVKITCTTSTLTQYYVARYKDPAIHMATYITAEPSVGELRFIARLRKAALPNGYRVSEIAGGTAIEGSDVFRVGSETRSKFYSSRQFIDDQVHGVTGNGIGAWMIIPGTGYESASGGPFFRDINNQGGMLAIFVLHGNSGHTQTESNRMGLHGPYALWFTSGGQPGTYDTAFWEGLGINGLVPKSNRGRVTGRASGIPSNFANLQSVGFSNGNAQYWARTDSSGQFTTPYMKPGTYTMKLYKVELAVASQQVTVNGGQTVTSNINSAEANPSAIWQIGDFDGTPRGFLNADGVLPTNVYSHSKIESMHPSDSRMSKWGPITFNVGSSVNQFPMALFKAVGPVTLRFTLNSSQGGARTLQIATTLAFAGGRPQVVVNNWTGPAPAAPSQPDSRGVTRGTWRGNNNLYTVNIPSGVLLTNGATNTITINVISGSSGDAFL